MYNCCYIENRLLYKNQLVSTFKIHGYKLTAYRSHYLEHLMNPVYTAKHSELSRIFIGKLMDSLFALDYIIVQNRFEASLIAITYANDGEENFSGDFLFDLRDFKIHIVALKFGRKL